MGLFEWDSASTVRCVSPSRIEEMARKLYGVYCEAVEVVASNGDPLPGWVDFAADSGKSKQVDAWRRLAEYVVGKVSTPQGK